MRDANSQRRVEVNDRMVEGNERTRARIGKTSKWKN